MRLGNVGVVLAGSCSQWASTRQGFLLLNVTSIVVFSVLVAAGWHYRRRPQTHKRLMLAATVGASCRRGFPACRS